MSAQNTCLLIASGKRHWFRMGRRRPVLYGTICTTGSHGAPPRESPAGWRTVAHSIWQAEPL